MATNCVSFNAVRIVRLVMVGWFCFMPRLLGMQSSGQQLALVTSGQGFAGSSAGAPHSGRMASDVRSMIERSAGNQQVIQTLGQIFFCRQMRRDVASQVFNLQASVDDLKKQLETKERELTERERLLRSQDFRSAELASFDALAAMLEAGASLTGGFSAEPLSDRMFLLYLREQASVHAKPILLAKLFEADPRLRDDIQNFGLLALTDEPQELTDSADKMRVLVQAGIDISRLSNVDSQAHALVREGKEEAVRSMVEKNPHIESVDDGKGKTVIEVAIERYIEALYKNGRRSSECEEAYKILKLLTAQQGLQQGAR